MEDTKVSRILPEVMLEKDKALHTANKLFDNLIWLNTKEASNYLRISPGSLRIRVHRGQIKAYKLGKSLRFKRSELDLMLESSLN